MLTRDRPFSRLCEEVCGGADDSEAAGKAEQCPGRDKDGISFRADYPGFSFVPPTYSETIMEDVLTDPGVLMPRKQWGIPACLQPTGK